MATLETIAKERIKLLEAKRLKRELTPTARGEGVRVERAGRALISFACNDYLGLSHHPAVLRAGQEALARYGAGAGASRLISGTHPLYAEAEALLAALKGTEAACIFGSGYLANIGAIPALVDGNDLILADKLSHACMLDGARLSGATVMRFAHNNAEHCRLLLEEHRAEFQHCLILTETVFSMDGDCAPISELAALAQAHGAWLMTDDAHGLGVAPHAAGADIQMGTLSKAAGAYGGYICASRAVVELLANHARSLMFSTALPPAVVACATAALRVMREDALLCARPLAHARMFTELLGLEAAQSAIVPVMYGEVEQALAASALLEERGFYVPAIRPPTVPPNAARLRFAFSALHTPEQIAQAAACVRESGFA